MAKKKKDKPPEQAAVPAAPVDYSLPDTNPVSDQVVTAWTQLLALATAQGASRRDIVLMTLATAHGVLKITGENLWPIGGDLPPDEFHGFGLYQTAYHATGQALQALGMPDPGEAAEQEQEQP